MLLELQNLGKSFGEHEVLKDVNAGVERGDRIGIIGANGTGKTTLLRILCGESLPDAGDAAFGTGVTCGYLEQNARLAPTLDIYATMKLAFAPALDAMQKMDDLQRRLAADPHNTALTEEIAHCTAIVDAMDAYNMDTQIKKVLNGMGFPVDTWVKLAGVLSGGEQTRLRLARLLLERPDLLILDEPTNHLDLETMEWLENYLKTYRGAVLVVSHDRYFLDAVCTRIWELRGKTIKTYRGNYSAYLPQREAADERQQKLHDAAVEKAAKLRDEVELLGAGRDFDMQAVRNGTLSPVFFGSALTTFGVEPFLEEFLRMTTAPLPRVSDQGEVDVFSPDFSAFVFKIQANMNKAHRDRLAFMRICSGKFERDTEYYHVQSGKKLRLSQPQTMMAAEREIVEEAYAGDIIGVFDPGLFAIGDTITVPGKKFRYSGIPTFEPEHFMRVSPKDTMKRKQFIKGTEQIAQEGAIQIFKIPGAGLEEVIVGVVGTLQFDVFEYRMKNEYNVDLRMSSLPYDHLRLIESMDCHPDEIVLCTGAAVLQDFRDRYLLAFDGEWSVGFLTKHNPSLVLADTLSV